MPITELEQPEGASYAEALELALASLELAGLPLSQKLSKLLLSPTFQELSHEERRNKVLEELDKID